MTVNIIVNRGWGEKIDGWNGGVMHFITIAHIFDFRGYVV
jgi:hypothetical protein